MTTKGLHHVTAIAGAARRNLDFYARTLGLKLVKKTVNYDDPRTYHFYLGDAEGAPGTLVTFFPWERSHGGRAGVGETQETAFAVPEASLGYWMHRLVAHGVAHEMPIRRFGDRVLLFRDPDGMRLALVATGDTATMSALAADGEVPAEHGIRGVHGVRLLVDKAEPTGTVLSDIFGMREIGREDGVVRYAADGEGPGRFVDVHGAGGFLPGRQGAGSVHHIAFRAQDDAAQAGMVEALRERHGLRPTAVRDRNYFRSVYFREPGGVLFEIATDDPGFTIDEPGTALGGGLMLPPRLEPQRASIEARLPVLD